MLINVDKNSSATSFVMNRQHKHKFFEFYFLIKGSRFFSIDEFTYKISSNNIIIVPINTPHLTNGGPFERYTLNVFSEILTDSQRKLIDSLISKQPLIIPALIMDRIKLCLDEIISISNLMDYQQKSYTIFSYMLFLIENYITTTENYTSIKKVPIYIYKAIDYINENIDKDLSIATISKHINFSSDYLSKQFKIYMKQSLYDYVLTERLTKVKNYLWNSRLPINKIAKLCGFSSSNYLTLIFTKKEKISPSKYRKIKFPLR